VKPKMTKTVLQYVILTKDERDYSQVFFVDTDKYDKQKFVELVKEEYSKKYRIAKDDVEVVFLVELPRVSTA
ncbi:MAG: hypothetical protein QXG57_08520, partial [Thermofilaceae archaeon]